MDDRTKKSISTAAKHLVFFLLMGAGIILGIQSGANSWQALLAGPALVAAGVVLVKYKLFKV